MMMKLPMTMTILIILQVVDSEPRMGADFCFNIYDGKRALMVSIITIVNIFTITYHHNHIIIIIIKNYDHIWS